MGLLWHTVFNENLGVGALTIANATLLVRAAERHGYRPVLHLMGSHGAFDYGHEMPGEHDFMNVQLKALLNPFSRLNRLLRQCDIVFDIGGGDSFSDIYFGKRYWLIILSKIAVGAARTPLVFSPQTIGPFHTPMARRLAVAALKIARKVFARDEVSLAVLEGLGVAEKSALTCDVAFALPYHQQAARHESDGEGRPLKFGLNVSALLYRTGRSPHSNVRLTVDYPALIHSLLERLTGDPQIDVHLVSHVISGKDAPDPAVGHFEDDYAVAHQLKSLYPQVQVAPKFASPVEAKSYIASLDVFSGSRMHATIAAISSDTPVIPLGYSRKFNGLFESIGYSYNIDLTCETNEAVLARFDAALTDVPTMRAEAKAASAEARRRLGEYEAYLDEVIGKLAPRHV
ncbi:Polysaccharide pyruvyl transferase [Erythrobacter dokdonensis DSW-74]|uniref:Polysaccharide pyruvyl transferase n=1 Tax=Erythrobacter dokdonensis DSW-74 TaxID=1300349 RepID=A0A1A7BFE2_9SPHN|nr:Polysaccharide pyruvyl transferase [Erythrobacter dokdonensis DSW-74]